MKLYHFFNPKTEEEFVVFVNDEELMNIEEWQTEGDELQYEGDIPDGIIPTVFPTNRVLIKR